MDSAIAAGMITPRNPSLPAATGAPDTGAEAGRNTAGPMHDTRPPARTYYTGAALAVAAAAMLMAGLTSALVVRKGVSNDWTPLVLPRMFYLNTALLIASSAVFEWVRRRQRYGDAATVRNARQSWRFVGVVALGLAFLAGQAAALRQLVLSGAVAAANPAVSFVYLFAGAHGALALGGLIAVAGAALKVNRETDRDRGRAMVGAASLYWHWVAALWVYILVLLVIEM